MVDCIVFSILPLFISVLFTVILQFWPLEVVYISLTHELGHVSWSGQWDASGHDARKGSKYTYRGKLALLSFHLQEKTMP